MPLDWALGAFILQSSEALKNMEQTTHSIGSVVFADTSSVLILVAIVLVLVSTAMYCNNTCTKPQLKTIYDLEKGKYIITRVNNRHS